jgi:DNA-binding MarR family transcriptional regulator
MNIKDSQDLWNALKVLDSKLGWRLKDEATCCGITAAQCNLLLEIGESKDLSAIDLSQKTGLDTSTLSRTINNMVDNKLVMRTPSTNDRRYITLSLTNEGNKHYNGILNMINSYFDNIISKIPSKKQVQVLESIILLSDAMCDENNINCCSIQGDNDE